jgi:dipeptidyl aminopeptidase/acylaminoacyl peptidase
VDVQDVISASRALSSPSSPEFHLIDVKRICIRGGSAGGYTVLASLSIAPGADVEAFAAGASFYGISDLAKLGEDTHKFESRYLDKLVGGTYKEVPQIYKKRSPVEHADRIVKPLLVIYSFILFFCTSSASSPFHFVYRFSKAK